MIESKVFELRDKMTFIPIVATRMQSHEKREQWLIRRAGYADTGPYLVLLTRLDGGRCHYDMYDWADRTFTVAHQHIQDNWMELKSGALLDVRVILGEATQACESEQAP